VLNLVNSMPLKSASVRSFFVLSISLTFAVSGCVDQSMGPRIDKLERGLNEVRAINADQTTEISNIQTSMRELLGKVEEMEYSQTNRVGGALTDLQRDLSTLKRRVPPPAIVPAATLEADEAMVDRLPPELGPKLGEALIRIREGKFDQAVPSLQEGLSLASEPEFGAIFAFWLGVALEGAADNNRALAAYSEFSGRFRKNARAPMALLRQAVMLVRMGDKKAGKLTMQKLIAEHPKSPEAIQVRSRIKDL